MKFNDRLKLLRKEKRLSRDDLANMLGISYSTVAKYETGTREPDLDTLKKITNIFEVTTDYLLGETDKPNISDDDEIKSLKDKIATEYPDIDLMFHDLANMTVEELEEVYEFVKFKRSQKKKGEK